MHLSDILQLLLLKTCFCHEKTRVSIVHSLPTTRGHLSLTFPDIFIQSLLKSHESQRTFYCEIIIRYSEIHIINFTYILLSKLNVTIMQFSYQKPYQHVRASAISSYFSFLVKSFPTRQISESVIPP